MSWKFWRFALAAMSASLCGQAAAGAAAAQAVAQPSDEIVVRGAAEQAERQVEALTRAITRRPRIDQPIARQFAGICVGVYGLSSNFTLVLIARIEANARSLGIHVLGRGCTVNTLVAFALNSRAEVQRLKKAEPWLFETLLDYEYDRILRGNGAAQSWQATQLKGADGKEFATIMIGEPPRPVQTSKQPFASNIADQLRLDVEGSIVVFDNAYVAGKSIQQLADYATMRLFAPTDDTSSGSEGGMATILSLFADEGSAPDGLTAFDRAFLGALYKLPPTARGEAIHDATWSAYRRGHFETKPLDRDN